MPGSGRSSTGPCSTGSARPARSTGPARSSTARACEPKRGITDRPNPVDRGKSGSKIHVLSDRNGLPLALGVSGANLHDSQAFEPLIQGIPKIRSRRGPRRRKPGKIHADKAYDLPDCHRALRERRIGDRIARRGIESSARLGRHRWVIERTIAWLGGYRRLTLRYERHGHLFAAFLALAAAITCYKKLAASDAP